MNKVWAPGVWTNFRHTGGAPLRDQKALIGKASSVTAVKLQPLPHVDQENQWEHSKRQQARPWNMTQ